MSINRNNYEAFFLDYFEGRLPEEGKEELMRFLELNPDLKKEFEGFEPVYLPKEHEVSFPVKILP